MSLMQLLEQKIERQSAEIEWLKDQLKNDPNVDRGCMCIYCGNMVPYDPSKGIQVAIDAAKAHDRSCPDNPLVAEIAQLRAAITTPEVYAGVVSEIVERDFAEQVKQLQQQNAEQAKEIERLKASNGNAFVAGAKWLEFKKAGATMWPEDQRAAEAEAERRGYVFRTVVEMAYETENAALKARVETLEEAMESIHCKLYTQNPEITETEIEGIVTAALNPQQETHQ